MVTQIQENVATLPWKISEAAKKSAVRVLVVDDERLVRWSVAETLGAHGYEVVEASDADSAMQVLAETAPSINLVLLDLFLPDSRDLSMLRLIRSCWPAMPVILMTAFATAEIIEQAFALGVFVMVKPFDINELARLVDRTLARPW
jgi:two-component system response regulator AtoC